eukprot:CAMPEP_0117422580 /NCGR_PEP_ID=MMETSP0758-20121206/3393_1 /TAXON_ID=63605 /ORGANISM="Percolomonas cosmopolitus, Strain AE-1 (ATCC 50343)" /LENGTH=152 /DNA_ID=CAMNT_0005205289 /DNA_START=632 /DNA_END=1087 /DNA_ORIENTATION=+
MYHPNIVNLIEVIDDGQDIYLIFDQYGVQMIELNVEGVVTKSAIPKTFQELQIKKLFYGLLLALDILHQQQITHNNIKPSSLYYDKHTQQLKLGNFERATTITQDNKGIEMKSLLFQAPEMYLNDQCDLKATDIYAAGMTLYCMIFGHLPYW